MWYFTWVLGLGLALVFGIVNAMWYEIREDELDKRPGSPSQSR
jgi:cyd operon protein YbgT